MQPTSYIHVNLEVMRKICIIIILLTFFMLKLVLGPLYFHYKCILPRIQEYQLSNILGVPWILQKKNWVNLFAFVQLGLTRFDEPVEVVAQGRIDFSSTLMVAGKSLTVEFSDKDAKAYKSHQSMFLIAIITVFMTLFFDITCQHKFLFIIMKLFSLAVFKLVFGRAADQSTEH